MIKMRKLWMDGDMGNVLCEVGKVMWIQSYMERGCAMCCEWMVMWIQVDVDGG